MASQKHVSNLFINFVDCFDEEHFAKKNRIGTRVPWKEEWVRDETIGYVIKKDAVDKSASRIGTTVDIEVSEATEMLNQTKPQ